MTRPVVALCLILACLPTWVQAGCRSSRIDTLCAAMAEDLVASIQVRLNRGAAIMAVSFVDLHRMDQTSSLGRILGEEIGNNFHLYGYRLIEPRLRTQTLTTHGQTGEFALSRDLGQIDGSVEIQAMLTGTYAVTDGGVLVSARVVHAVDRSLLATAQCQLRLTPEVAALLDVTQPPPSPRATAALNPFQKSDARLIQRKLQTLGLYRGKIDGMWGRGSAAALRQFKAIRGLPAVPEWDQTTQESLFAPK